MLEDPIETTRDLGRQASKPAMHALRLEAAWAALRLARGDTLAQVRDTISPHLPTSPPSPPTRNLHPTSPPEISPALPPDLP